MKKVTRKFFTLIMAITLCCSITSCDTKNNIATEKATESITETATRATTQATTKTTTQTTTETTTESTTEAVSSSGEEVEEAYTLARTLTKGDLTQNYLGLYEYDGFAFTSEDSDWIDNSMNTTDSVEAGAFYRKMANCLEGFDMGNTWESYAEMLIGCVPSYKSDFEEYVDNASSFITTDEPLRAVMDEFSKLDHVSDFDPSKKKYELTIDNLEECANEMKISQEMLGYILAMLTEYGTNITFDNNTATVEYVDYSHDNSSNDNEDDNDYEDILDSGNDYEDDSEYTLYITINEFRENLKAQFGSDLYMSSVAESDSGISLFSFESETCGKWIVYIDNYISSIGIDTMIINPKSVTEDQAEHYFDTLQKIVCANDPDLEDYEAMVLVLKCSEEATVEGDSTYILDTEETFGLGITHH